MSVSSKTVIGLMAAVVVVGGVFAYLHHKAEAPTSEAATDTTTLPSGDRTDDAALSSDLSAIDTQLTASDGDVNDASASVDAASQ